MKNKLVRLATALCPLFAMIFIWATWETELTPMVDRVYETKPALIRFHQTMDTKISNGELSKDEAIHIYKRNALDGQEADEEIAELFKFALMFLFLSLSVCILVTSIRVIILEAKSDWKL